VKTKLYWIGLIVGLGIVLWNLRWTLVYKFDSTYWENYYYESQWNVANSKRVIPDEGVYRYIGYRLVNGENPFNIDYWVPPFGKYWYGFGAKYLNNPYLISIGWYLISIALMALIANMVVKDREKKWMMIYLMAFNPLVVFQISQTMLDLPQMVCFLAQAVFLLRFEKNKKIYEVILAGLFLGLMAGTKPAYFVSMIGLVDLWWIYKFGGIRKILFFIGSVVMGYLVAYTCYFVAHPNPVPFIRLHDKIIAFQKGNGGSHDVFNIFRTIFLNRYKGFWIGGREITMEGWSPLLPIGLITMIVGFIKQKNIQLKYFGLVGMGYILMNLTIDFWPRYLVLLVPILIVAMGANLDSKKWLKWMLVFEMPFLYLTLFPSSEKFVEGWNSLNSQENYKETYQMLSAKSKEKIMINNWVEKPVTDINRLNLVKENNQWRMKINEK